MQRVYTNGRTNAFVISTYSRYSNTSSGRVSNRNRKMNLYSNRCHNMDCIRFTSHQQQRRHISPLGNGRYNSIMLNTNRNCYHLCQSTKLFSTKSNTQEDFDGNHHNYPTTHEKNEFVKLFVQKIESFLHTEIITKMLSPTSSPSSSSSNNDILSTIHILLAVSGGCDSIALLHTIMQIPHHVNLETRQYNVKVHVVHYDHEQRGKESDGDRIFVENLCKEYNVPFHCYYWSQRGHGQNVDEKCDTNETFSQDIARNWRRQTSMELLDKICSSGNSDDGNQYSDSIYGLLLTAHHKDDSEETMIMKLLRGVHLTNWSGMAPVQKLSSKRGFIYQHLYLGKPMLCVRKKEIYDFLQYQDLHWREDESNQSDKYFRNRVRHQLMPVLQDLVGGEDILESRLTNIVEQSHKLRQDISSRAQIYISETSSQFPIPRNSDGRFTLVEEEALHMWICNEANHALSLSYDKISMVCEQISNFPERRQWKLSLGGDWNIKRNGNVLELEMQNDTNLVEQGTNKDEWFIKSHRNIDVESNIKSNGDGDILLTFSLSQWGQHESRNFSLKKVQGNEKMTFIPPWRKQDSGVKIKEFLRGQNIPLHLRNNTPILCIEIGGDVHIGAVYIDNELNKRWIVNGMFIPEEDETNHLDEVMLWRNINP